MKYFLNTDNQLYTNTKSVAKKIFLIYFRIYSFFVVKFYRKLKILLKKTPFFLLQNETKLTNNRLKKRKTFNAALTH